MSGGIYTIVHKHTNKAYVGQTNSFAWRWQQHKAALDENCHHNSNLQTLWSTDGSDAFEFQIVEQLPSGLTALARQRWLLKYELLFWEKYRDAGLALNIVRPEIVETPEALEQFDAEEGVRIRSENVDITSQLKAVKQLIAEVHIQVFNATRTFDELSQSVAVFEALIKRNSGWRALFFGKNSSESIETLERNLATELKFLTNAKSSLDSAILREKELIARRKNLYSSYPKNAARQIRRNSFFVGKSRVSRMR